MRPLAYTFPYVVVFLAVFFWSFVREARIVRRAGQAARSGNAPRDRGSLYVVMWTQGLGFGLGFFLAWKPFGRFTHQHVAFWAGIALMLAGTTLRRLSFRALGEFFTGEVRVREDQRVVTTGPYAVVRHPGYLAGIMMVVGVAIALGTWFGALVGLALTALGYAYRVSVEERALVETLGEPYRSYMARTKRFIPHIY